jgi:hypothetical protein
VGRRTTPIAAATAGIKNEEKTTMDILHRRKSRGFPLDRIMAPDTMTGIFGVKTF